MNTINATTRDALILARESTGEDLEVRASRLADRFNIVRIRSTPAGMRAEPIVMSIPEQRAQEHLLRIANGEQYWA